MPRIDIMPIITISNLPPDILQSYSRYLLSVPAPKFYEDSETLYKVYQYIKHKLQKKTYRSPIQDAKFIELERTFLELYESALEKEKEFKAKKGNDFRKWGNYFRDTSRYHKGLFARLKWKI